MNNNGMVVLVGLFLIVIGILNQVSNDTRIILSSVLVIIGIAAILIGVAVDKIE